MQIVPEAKENILPEFNLEKQKNEVALRLENSPEVSSIARQINIQDPDSIMGFGKSTAEELAKFSDKILHSMQVAKVEDSGEMLVKLNKIMEKFDIKDFKEKEPGFLEKMFKRAKSSIEVLFQKYQTMGDEVDKVFIVLKQYDSEINTTNKSLEEMFAKNLAYYEQLELYIYAGDLAVNHLKNTVIPEMEGKASDTGDKVEQVNLNNMRQMLEMLEQRVYDLRLAENIALQSMPMIKSIEYGNYNLVRKINSAFIITLPIFKQCLTQAIMLKRQAIQAKAMSALDEKTNQLLLRNAENLALQTKLTAQLAGGSFVNIETLEKSWQTIVRGIEETQKIQEEIKQKRIDGTGRLARLKDDFRSRNLT